MTPGTIFVVDDNPKNVALLSRILQDAGYDVRAANSGRRFLQMVERGLPELVMLDIQMPEMDGYEVCRRLKTDEATRAIPVIFISALDDVSDKVSAFRAGGVDYVTKPFQAEEVLARVEAQVKVFRLQRELEERNGQLETKQRELERRNEELARTNAELVEARKRTDLVFSALSEALPGTVLDDKYRLDLKIGAGGFGAVFRATHLGLDRAVAVKVFRPAPGNDSPDALERFRQEGITACRFTHLHAVSVTDFGISSTGIAYLVMELLRGYTLKETLLAHGSLPLPRCAEIVLPVCEALAEAHAAGIVHRDVKPDNVFLHQTKDGEVVKVVDFGIAKMLGQQSDGNGLTEAGNLLGTPGYIAPERVLGKPYDGRSDVYSVGVMLYRMLCGHLPFRSQDGASPYAVALMQVTEEPRAPRESDPSIPAAVEAVILQALAANPVVRPTARELAARFAAAIAEGAAGASPA